MKKTLIVLVSLIITLLSVSVALAATSVDNVINNEKLLVSKDKTGVETVINEKAVKAKEFLVKHKDDLNRKELSELTSTDDLKNGNPYRVLIANTTLVNALLEGTDLSSVLKDAPYHWEVPLISRSKPVASFTVDDLDGKWEISEIGGYLSPDDSYFSSDTTIISKYLKDFGLSEADYFSHIRIPSLHMDVLYISAPQKEYFVPLLHSRDTLLGLNNKQIYDKNEFILAVGDELKNGLNNNQRSGVPKVNETNVATGVNLKLILSIGLATLVVASILFIYFNPKANK